MFEAFTNTTQSLTQNAPIVFSNVKFSDNRMRLSPNGESVVITTPGRYLVSFNGVGGSSNATTEFTIQLSVNGNAQPCAQTSNTVSAVGELGALSFTTLIQVNQSCCCSNNSQVLQFIATDATAGSVTHANVTIVRL